MQTNTHNAAEKIAEISPEGRPAQPHVRGRHMGLIIGVLVVGLLAASIALAIFVQPVVGLAAAGFGLLMLALNPTTWASLQRARERSTLDES